MANQLKRTALFDRHVELGGRMVPFGGWEMPVQYSSIKDEHLAVRQHAGVFDICHMGEFLVEGPSARNFLNSILSNDVQKLNPGQGQYTLMCHKNGGVIDDLYLYCLQHDSFLLIVNASRLEEDWQWVSDQKEKLTSNMGRIDLDNKSDSLGAIAIQGPSVRSWIDDCFSIEDPRVTEQDISKLQKNQIGTYLFDSKKVWIGVTGYTGEDGFEIIAPNEIIPEIWDSLLAKGHIGCLQPAGLGARDTLRTEMCYPLYGHELTTETTPLEAGLGYFVDLNGDDFIGKQALIDQKSKGLTKKLIAFRMTGRSAPPRPEYKVLSSEGKDIGTVSSGTSSPSLSAGIGMAFVDAEHAKIGNLIEIEIRGRSFPAEIVKKPIYRKH